eukprot:g2165.t1
MLGWKHACRTGEKDVGKAKCCAGGDTKPGTTTTPTPKTTTPKPKPNPAGGCAKFSGADKKVKCCANKDCASMPNGACLTKKAAEGQQMADKDQCPKTNPTPTPDTTTAAPVADGPGPCAGRDKAKKGDKIWCKCNVDKKKISKKEDCENPGGGRAGVCAFDDGKKECTPSAKETDPCDGRDKAKKGDKVWCKCNADKKKITKKEDCENPGGGRADVCAFDDGKKECTPSGSTPPKSDTTTTTPKPDAPAVPSGKRTCAFCKYWDVVNEECGDPVKAKHVGSATCKFANECAKKNKGRKRSPGGLCMPEATGSPGNADPTKSDKTTTPPPETPAAQIIPAGDDHGAGASGGDSGPGGDPPGPSGASGGNSGAGESASGEPAGDDTIHDSEETETDMKDKTCVNKKPFKGKNNEFTKDTSDGHVEGCRAAAIEQKKPAFVVYKKEAQSLCWLCEQTAANELPLRDSKVGNSKVYPTYWKQTCVNKVPVKNDPSSKKTDRNLCMKAALKADPKTPAIVTYNKEGHSLCWRCTAPLKLRESKMANPAVHFVNAPSEKDEGWIAWIKRKAKAAASTVSTAAKSVWGGMKEKFGW